MNIKKTINNNKILSSLIKPVYFALKRRPGFSSKEYWNKRYVKGGNSGPGSYGELAEFKARILNAFIKEHGIKHVLEFGSGDGNQLRSLEMPEYIGLDVAKDSILRCQSEFFSDSDKSFYLYDQECFVDKAGLFKAELTMSLDVIFHLTETPVYEKYMQDLFDSSEKYVVIYSSDTDVQDKLQAQHVRHRKFTDWIKENHPEAKLLKTIKNEYPNETSADFYFYEK